MRWAETGPRSVSAALRASRRRRPARCAVEAQSCAWILTSATLAVGDDFSHFKRRCRAARAHEACASRVPSISRTRRCSTCRRVWSIPAATAHPREVIRAACRCWRPVAAAPSCCSRAIARLREGALEEFAGAAAMHRPCPCWCRARRRATSCCAAFREAGNAVLLGTGSFWEGVDVKGRHSVVVVIDKLPFAVPDDPLLKATAGRDTRARRQPVLRRTGSAGGDRTEAGRRPPDPRRGGLRRRHALRPAARDQGLRPRMFSTACRRCSARAISSRCRPSCASDSAPWPKRWT